MPTEKGYVEHMKKNYKLDIAEKNRFNLIKVFEETLKEMGTEKHKIPLEQLRFRKLKAIEDPDEQMESLHCVR